MEQKELLNTIMNIIDDNKGNDTVTIKLPEHTNVADYFVITSAISNKHASTIAEKIIITLKQHGLKSIHCEGLEFSDWIVIDVNGIIVHVFKQEVRDYYNIEEIWK